MNILHKTNFSGIGAPPLQNIEKTNIDREYNYVPMQQCNAVTLSAVFKRNTNTFFLRNQELRLGTRFNSYTIPAVVIKEKTQRYYHQFHPIGKDLNLDIEFNLFAELNMGYNYRKYIDIKLIESVYIGTSPPSGESVIRS